MRVLFAGTPRIAVPSLEALADSSHELVGVLTAPDRRRGRGKQVSYAPVKEYALELGVPVLQPTSLRTEAREAVLALEPDLLACFAYGRIFGPRFLALFERGALNVHPSLLPRFRGPAPSRQRSSQPTPRRCDYSGSGAGDGRRRDLCPGDHPSLR